MSIAVIFPGQGSQEKGMGRDVAEQFGWAMALWETAEKESGLGLREIYWDGEASDMADTRALQPALSVVNITLWMAAKEKLSPTGVAGHSLGEYSALAAAGVLSPEETIKAVTLRGRLMAECGGDDQGMAAVVKLPVEQVQEMVSRAANETGKTLVVANYNSPGQVVVSGQSEALNVLAGAVKQAKGRAITLAVSGAFHSPLIAEAAKEFKQLLVTLDWKAPAIPIFFNATAKTEKNIAAIEQIMCDQMTSSVRWMQIMNNMFDAGARRFAEVGPKNVLSKLAGQNLKDRDGVETLNIASLEAVQAL